MWTILFLFGAVSFVSFVAVALLFVVAERDRDYVHSSRKAKTLGQEEFSMKSKKH